MTFIPNERGKVSTLNSVTLASSGGSQNTIGYNMRSNTAQAGAVMTITLDAGASAVDDTYNNYVIEIISGKGLNNSRLITDYVGSIKEATVDRDWDIIPDSSSVFVIHQNSGQCQSNVILNGNNASNTLVLSSTTASAVDNFYKGAFIKILDCKGINQTRSIIAYNGTTKTATVSPSWSVIPSTTSLYAIYGEGGTTASGSTSSTIVLDGNQSSIAGTQYLYIDVFSGTGAGQIRQITSISTNTITVATDWDTIPVSGDEYVIFGGWGGTYEDVTNFSLMTIVGAISIGSGERAILDMQLGLNSQGTVKRGKFAEASTTVPSTVHTLTVVTDYYRLRIVDIGNGLNGSLQCIFNSYKSGKLTTFIGETINQNNDCELVRAIITGKQENGLYQNVSMDSKGALDVSIRNPLTSFGDISVAQTTPVSQIKFIYGLNGVDTEIFRQYGTSVTVNVEASGATPASQSIYLPSGGAFTDSGAGDYFTLDDGQGNAFYAWYDVDGGNTDPTPGGTGLQISISASSGPTGVAAQTAQVLDADAAFSASRFGSIVTIVNATTGAAQPYTSINATQMPSTSESSATGVKGSATATLTTGEGTGDYSVMRGTRQIRYNPGQGVVARWTAVYDEPEAGIDQYSGVGNSTSALYVGYNGTQFKISRRTGGKHKIAELKFTGGSVAGGDTTVKIDGVDFTVNLSASLTVQETAQEIGDVIYRSALYNTDVIDDKVIFLSERISAGTGTRTFSFDSLTSGATGAFTSITEASATTNDDVNREDFNIDRLDGSGPSGIVLKPEYGNVYQVRYQWLGYGNIVFSVENPTTGFFVPFHQIEFPNTSTIPSLSQPDMQLTWFVASTIANVGKSIVTSSGGAFVEGSLLDFDPSYSIDNEHAGLSASGSNVVLMALRNPRTFNGITNQVQFVLKQISVGSTKSANNTKALTKFSIVQGGTPSTAVVFTENDPTVSPAVVAEPVAGTTLSGGRKVFTLALPSEGTATEILTNERFYITKNSTWYITYTNSAPSTGTIDVDASIAWVELQ